MAAHSCPTLADCLRPIPDLVLQVQHRAACGKTPARQRPAGSPPAFGLGHLAGFDAANQLLHSQAPAHSWRVLLGRSVLGEALGMGRAAGAGKPGILGQHPQSFAFGTRLRVPRAFQQAVMNLRKPCSGSSPRHQYTQGVRGNNPTVYNPILVEPGYLPSRFLFFQMRICAPPALSPLGSL